ncbi:DUF4010 domain-containing protein [Sulfurimonas sp. HSL-1716]|uniref:MgtC/SapB family protein n=1 Tax=Hydrocurvibacter sulfurireducens TaxID=3131937 RepID=UPI0031F9C945
MLESFLNEVWVEFIVVITAGLLIGLEIKEYRVHHDTSKEIGSVRTFSFIALIGFIFAKIDMLLYIIGYIAIVFHFALFYYFKLKNSRTGILLFLLSTLVYSFGMIVVKFDIWFLIVVFVAIIFISNLNKKLGHFYTIFDEREIETFAKLLLLSAVILPLLPHTNISEFIPVSYFKVWLAVVVVSMFSYVGYVLKKYVFKEKGYLLAGILGGIYSSTATTIVLAKKASRGDTPYLFTSSIIMATAFMYIRLLGIAYTFDYEIASKLLVPFSVFTALSALISYIFYKRAVKEPVKDVDGAQDKNPLELSTAFIFAFLFIAMSVITHFVFSKYGNIGLNVLSFVIGFTDIDPFVLSILSSKFNVTVTGASTAIIIAAGSNNILKAFYSYIFSKNKAGKMSALMLLLLGALTIGAEFI